MILFLAAALVELVDPFIGTDGAGHTHPGAAAPFGMVQAGPDTGAGDWEHCSLYRHSDLRILGFSQTHLSGTGWVDYGDVQIVPYADRRYREEGSRFERQSERARPGYYSVCLSDFGVTVEATASERVAVYRLRYPRGAQANLLVNLPFGAYEKRWAPRQWAGHSETVENDRLIVGSYRRTVWATRTVAYAIAFDAPAEVTVLEPVADEPPRLRCRFGTLPGGELAVRIALSRTSPEAARRNLLTADALSFDDVRRMTESRWESLLSRFDARGPESARRVFYTALYHCAFQPNLMSDAGERPLYTTFSIWDASRACFPLYALWTPEMVRPFIDSFMAFYGRQGYLPIFTLGDCETHCMIANHAIAVLEGWRQSGVAAETDWKAVYEAVSRSLRRTIPQRPKMWDYDLINRYGYLPYDRVEGQSVSRTLEKCLDDAAAARMALSLNEQEDARFFEKRSFAWTNLFDSAKGFFRGRNADGSWRSEFDPLRCDHSSKPGGEFTEGNAWQYRWHVLQHPEALVAQMGGGKAFASELDRLFRLPATVYGNDLTVDITGMIGQYVHGNEPCHHIPYFYQYAGRPDRTAEWVREICRSLYTVNPDGLCGNDDCGQISAWYVFACMGFYPFDPSSGKYVLGAPQLPCVSLKSPNGSSFSVRANGLSEGRKYVRATFFTTPDGRERELFSFVLGNEEIRNGGELRFDMVDRPQNLGERNQ